MLSGRGGFALLALFLSLASRARAQFDYQALTSQTALQSGDGTFYGAGQDSQGTCSFSSNFADTNSLPWTTGAALTLALNDNQFDNSAACGLCVMYRGTGAGLGTTPIPSTWTLGFVNNRCPECSKGDLDQATSGDGRWKVEWYAVPCNVGDSPLVYSIVVSSYYWFSLVVSNTRYPITAVSIQLGGTWLPLKRSNNNQWAYYNTNGPWQSAFPLPIQVTDVMGETVSDTITSQKGNTGAVQFGSGGSGGSTATPTLPTSSPPTAAATPAYPGSLASPPPAVLPSAPPPAAPVAAVPPVVTSPPAPLPDGNFYIENYQQCGGGGGSCNTNPYTAAPCQDIAWPRATCQTLGFGCTRYDTTLWSCIPSANATFPPPPVFFAPPPQAPAAVPPPSGSLPTLSSPPTASSAASVQPALQSQGPIQSLAGESPPPAPVATTQSPPPVAASSPPPAPVTSTPPPVNSASSPPPAALSPPPVSAPPPPQEAASSPPPPVAQSPPPTTSSFSTTTNSFTVADNAQCGGTSQCAPVGTPTDKVTCNNGPWAGASCNGGFSCQPDPGPLIWSCKSSSVATGGRRLLGS